MIRILSALPVYRRAGLAVVAATAVAAAALAPTAASAADDPRGGLATGEEVAVNVTRLSSSPLPQGAAINSDLAFTGSYAVAGNFNGFSIYDVSNPASPSLVTSYLCPGSQNDVSVYGNLLFLSVEQTTARADCSTPAATNPAPVFRGVRIFDISDVTRPVLLTNVPTCRGSHTHTLVEDLDDPSTIYVYVSGTSNTISPESLIAGCGTGDAASVDPARWRIDVIAVPLAAPQTAALVAGPRLFTDPVTGRIDGLQNEPPTPLHPSGTNWGPTPVTDACHDITAYPEIGLAAGACEGNGILIDIRDPANPVRVAEASDPNFAYWHSATFNNDGTKVVFTDEWGGGTGARCRDTDRPEWGANAIFDVVRSKKGGISLEFASYYKIPNNQSTVENCVAHNGSLVPVPGRDIMVQAWYQGGTSVFDFTDSAAPREIAFFDRGPINPATLSLAGFWSTYWYNGAVYGTEIGRGFDSFALGTSDALNDVELAAAVQVVDDEVNVQAQERITWPASFVTVRAWLSAAIRQGELSDREVRNLTRAIDRAEERAGKGRTDKAADILEDAAEDLGRSTVERGLARALEDLARDLEGDKEKDRD